MLSPRPSSFLNTTFVPGYSFSSWTSFSQNSLTSHLFAWFLYWYLPVIQKFLSFIFLNLVHVFLSSLFSFLSDSDFTLPKHTFMDFFREGFTASKGFPGGWDGQESACYAGEPGSIPGLERSPGEKNSYPLQYSCLENSMERGVW